MANIYNANPIIIDTVMGAGITNERIMPIHVKTIRWVGGTTAGHQATITDGSAGASILWRAICQNANIEINSLLPQMLTWKNFRVTVLASGILYIYHA